MKKKKVDLKIAAVFFACANCIFLTGCGEKTNSSKGIESAIEEQSEQNTEDIDVAEDTEEENLQATQALYEALIRHQYGAVLSQLIAAWQLPDMEIDTSSLNDGFGEMKDNSFSVTDIDGDGKEELIITYANASMAGMFEVIYDYDPKKEELRQEFLNFPSVSYYDNNIIIAQASHNHSRGIDFWPINIYSYQADTDSYEWIAYVDTWSKEFSEVFDGDETKPFPEELDTDGDGILYNIRKSSESISDVYEDYQYNKEDYETWYQSLMSGAEELQIDRKPMEYESFTEFTPTYLRLIAEKANRGRTDTDSDLGLFILKDDGEHFLNVSKKLLSEKYGVTVEQPEPEFEEYTVGILDGKEIFSFTMLDSGDLTYSDEKIGDVTIFGIYPGISADGALEKLKAYGFYTSPYREAENSFITGEGFGNVSIWFEVEERMVTKITVRPFCAFAG